MKTTAITGKTNVTVVMLKVMLGLVPGIIAYVWYFGPAILISLAIASVAALIAEAILLMIRRVPVWPFLSDMSALLTAWLLALSMPPLSPWWLTVVATLFAIVIAKHVFGGLGYNPFNPAMAGFAAVLIAFPSQMSHWSPPGMIAATRTDFATDMTHVFREFSSKAFIIDAESMATPLDTLKVQVANKQAIADFLYMPIFSDFAGKGTEIIAICYLLGGLFLLQQRLITWHMPAVFLIVIAALAEFFHLLDPTRHAGPLFHLFGGATSLGALFIITDPVSAATTPKGKMIFAAGAALFTFVIRVFGGYPDGVAFAVLFMNMCVPLIDSYTQPPVFGRKLGKIRPKESP
ncbi:MAG: RnfABCDGE type electron transport complex subunit D [Burkholderiales bacterium]